MELADMNNSKYPKELYESYKKTINDYIVYNNRLMDLEIMLSLEFPPRRVRSCCGNLWNNGRNTGY